MNAFVRKGFNKTDSRGIEKKKKKKENDQLLWKKLSHLP